MVSFVIANAQNKKPKFVRVDKSLSKEEIAKVNPAFLDTLISIQDDGTMQMRIEVSRNLDTTYVEHPKTGELNIIVTRKKQSSFTPKSSQYKKGDTVYIEDPITNKIEMIITK